MTETPDSTTAADGAPEAKAADKTPRKRSGGLNSMLLADLKAMASGMGIAGVGGLKKAALVEAIKTAQASESGQSAPRVTKTDEPKAEQQKAAQPQVDQAQVDQPKAEQPKAEQASEPKGERADEPKGEQAEQAEQAEQGSAQSAPRVRTRQRGQGKQQGAEKKQGAPADEQSDQQGKQAAQEGQDNGQPKKTAQQAGQQKQGAKQDGRTGQQGGSGQQKQDGQQKQGAKQKQDGQQKQDDQQKQDGQQKQGAKQDGQQKQGNQGEQSRADDGGQDNDFDDDGEGGSRRNRRRRGRDRERTARSTREPDTEVREDDVLVPAAGILDVLDNYAFVRTSGYLAGADDVYLSLSMVRRFGLRRGDAITGQVRQPREGERREKFNPMVRIETVNGVDPEQSKNRVEFEALTPVSPDERLRMETGPENPTGRIIDLVAPIGKGQRGVIEAPGSAGKTTMLQAIANAVTANNPECHLMVVLLDERPEEVTDFERAIKGEVIASTFDRPATDHTTVAELAIERAKRLVELGHDVVVLLDGLTRLGRAYNLAAPPSGRILPGGVDAAALFPPKKFFGAARNVENGGSLTIIATALVESGSKMDEAIYEEFTGTANLRIRLRRELAERDVFPAIDPVASSTRRAELLLGKEEVAILATLRRDLAGRDPREAAEHLLEKVAKTQTNYEFLVQVQKTGRV